MTQPSISIQVRGPVFDGRAQHWTNQATRDWEHHLGSVGADYVHAELDRVLRTQTPYYNTQVTSTEYPGRTVINDQGVVYGPWLEGVGSRNRTTRFKGYATFRRMTQKLRADAPGILQPYADKLVDEINHR